MNKSKKGLLVVNENSIFYEIKTFFKRLFFKSENLVKEEKIEKVKIQNENNKTSSFLEDIKIEQIYDLKKSINSYKNKIISIRTKLVQSN